MTDSAGYDAARNPHIPRRGQFEYMTGIGTSWAACLICRRSVFTGGSGAEVEWWMDKHPARCPGQQEQPKLVNWREDVFDR